MKLIFLFVISFLILFQYNNAVNHSIKNQNRNRITIKENDVVDVTLQVHVKEEQKSKLLMNLKMLQQSSKQSQSISFLQNQNSARDIELKKQINAAKRLATYYGTVGVGIGDKNSPTEVQQFKMMFDTGSCEFWLQSDQCQTTQCKQHHRYSLSNTFKPYTEAELGIQYLSGQVTGKMGTDIINIGGIQVPNQIIGVATDVNIPLLDDVAWDGIIGLSFANHKLQNQHISPLMDTIISEKVLTQKGLKNQFSYFLGDNVGSVSFGKIDKRFVDNYDDEIGWVDLTEEYYWTVSLIDVRKEQIEDKEENQSQVNIIKKPRSKSDNIVKLCPDGCKAIVDTGTYLLYGPNEMIQDYLGDIVINDCSEKKDLPNLVFEFEESTENGQKQHVELTLTPDDYVLQFKIDGRDDCVIGIGPDQGNEWTLGQVFLRSFYTTFDRDNSRIGFMKSNPSPPVIGTVDYIKSSDPDPFSLDSYGDESLSSQDNNSEILNSLQKTLNI